MPGVVEVGAGSSVEFCEPSDRWSPASVVLGCLLVALILAGTSLLIRPAKSVVDEPITEDSYYALSVSRSMADGGGVTIDGVHPTNGFQPLFTLMGSVAFLLTPDDVSAIRLVLLLHLVVWLSCAWLVSLIVADWVSAEGNRRRVIRLATAVLFLGAAYIVHVGFNGLETLLALLGYLGIWRFVQVSRLESVQSGVVLGLIAGVTVLARIDAVFVVGALFVFLVLKRGWRPAVSMAVVAGAVSAPWWIYNYVEFGSLMPTSGQALWELRLYYSERRAKAVVSGVGDVILPWAFAGRLQSFGISLGKLMVAAAVLGAAWLLPPKEAALKGPRMVNARAFGYVLLAASAGIVVWYGLTSKAEWFYYRYFAPISLLMIVVLAVGLARTSRGWRPAFLNVAAIVVGLSGLMSFGVLWNSQLSGGNEMLNDQVALVRGTVPDDQVVAAGQSGTLGFWRAKVVNLDGKVNPDVLRIETSMSDYLRSQDIHWLCDWPDYVQGYLGKQPTGDGWKLVGRKGRFECWHR